MEQGADLTPHTGETPDPARDQLGGARVVVFTPTYNERDNLEPLIEQLLALSPTLRVLVVDDRSPDGTGALADDLARRHGRIEVMHRDPPRGRGLAGRDGLRRAGEMACDFVIEMDADLSHRPRDIPALVQACAACDVVLGSRYMRGGRAEGFGPLRRLNSGVAGALSRVVLGLREADCTSGFRCFRREALAKLDYDAMISDGPSIVGEILREARLRGFKVVEVPIVFVERTAGSSKITPRLILRWVWNLLRIRLKPRPRDTTQS